MPPKIYEYLSSDEESSDEEEKCEPAEYYVNKKGKLVKKRKRKVQPKKEKPKPRPSIIFEDDEKELNEWGIDIPLYKHQENSVLKMENLEDNSSQEVSYHDRYAGNRKIEFSSRVGILSDKVGSGKTLTTVSFLSRRKQTDAAMVGTEKDINKVYKKDGIEFINIEVIDSQAQWVHDNKIYYADVVNGKIDNKTTRKIEM
jgi:SNF2 family DNA or RNA helicase